MRLPDTTSRWEENCPTKSATGRKPAGHNQPPEGNLPDTTSHRKETCRTQTATGRKPAGHNQPPEGNLPDTTSRWEETCRTQPATGRKLPDTTSHRKETCRTQPAAGRKTAGHNQSPEGNCRKQPATGRKPAGHKQPNTSVSAPSVATWSQSHLFRGTPWTGDRKSTELQHPHTVNEMATRLPKVNSGTVSHDRQVSIFGIYLQTLCLLWVYCPGHAGVKGNDREDTLVGKVNEVLRSSRHFLQVQSQDITPSIAWRRESRKEEALHGLPCKTKKRHLQSNKQRNYLRLYHLLSLSIKNKTKNNNI